MRGVYGSGVGVGLEQLGMNETFDDLIGISAGAGNAAYFAAHQATVGPTVFYDDLSNGGFVSMRNPRNMMNLAVLAEVLRDKKPLDQRALRKSRSRLHIGMTDAENGRARYLNIRDMPEDFDVVNALIASSSIPGFTQTVIEIQGRRYTDGLTSCTDPVGYAADVLGATDILVVMNRPLSDTPRMTLLEKAVNRIMLRRFTPEFIKAHEDRHRLNGLIPSREYGIGISVGVLCPERNLVSHASTNSRSLRKVADLATAQTVNIFRS